MKTDTGGQFFMTQWGQFRMAFDMWKRAAMSTGEWEHSRWLPICYARRTCR